MFFSTQRCDKLLARRVARDEGAVQAGVPISFIAMLARLLVLAGICMGRCLLAGRAGDVPRPRHRVPVRGRGCCGKPDAAYVFAAHLAASRPTSDLGTNRGLLVFLSFHVQTSVNKEVGGVRCRRGHGPPRRTVRDDDRMRHLMRSPSCCAALFCT